MADPNDPANYLAGLGIKPTAGGAATTGAAIKPPPPPAGWVEIMPGIAYNPSFSLDKAGTGTMVRYLGPDIGWTTPTKATPDVVAAGRGSATTQPQQAATATAAKSAPTPVAGNPQTMQTPFNKAGNSTAFQTPSNYIPGPSGFTAQGPFGPESAGPYDIQTAGGPILGVSTGGISHPGDMSHGLNYERILADAYGSGRPWTSGDQATDAVMAANVERARNFAGGITPPTPQPTADPMAARPSTPMAQSSIGQAIGMGGGGNLAPWAQGLVSGIQNAYPGTPAPVAQSFTPAPAASNLPPDRAAFIAQMAPIAEAWSAKTGIPPEVYLAINGSESNFGKASSLFGVKGEGDAGSNNYATHEVVNGQNVPETDKFANYSDPNAAYQGFHNFLADNPRYAPALAQFQQDKDAGALLQNINKAGYATDPNWANMVMGMAQDIKPALGQANPPMQPIPNQPIGPAPSLTPIPNVPVGSSPPIKELLGGPVPQPVTAGFDFAPITNPTGLPPAPPTIPIAPLGPSQGNGGGAGGGGSWNNIVINPLSPLSPQNLPGDETRINPLGGQPAIPTRNLLDTPQIITNPLNPLSPTAIYSTNPSQILINPLDPMHPISVPSPAGPAAQVIGSQPSALNPQGPFARTTSSLNPMPGNGTSSQFPAALTSGPVPSNPLNNNVPAPSFIQQAVTRGGQTQPSAPQPSFLDQARQIGTANSAATAAMAGIGAGVPPSLSAPLVPSAPPAPQVRTQPFQDMGNTTKGPGDTASAFTPAPAPTPQDRRTPPAPDYSGTTGPNFGATGLFQSPLSGQLENVTRTDSGYVFSPGVIGDHGEGLRSPMGGYTPVMTPSGVVIQSANQEGMSPAAQIQAYQQAGYGHGTAPTSNPGAVIQAAAAQNGQPVPPGQFFTGSGYLAGSNPGSNLEPAPLGYANAGGLPSPAALAALGQSNADAQAAQDKAAADAAAAAAGGSGMMGADGGTRGFAAGGFFTEAPGGHPARLPFTGDPALDRYLQTPPQNRPSNSPPGAGSGSPMSNSPSAHLDPMRGFARGGNFMTTTPTMFPMAGGGTAVTSEYGQPERIHTAPVPGGRIQVHVQPVRGYAAGGTFQTDPNAVGGGPTDPMAASAPTATSMNSGVNNNGGFRTRTSGTGEGTTTSPETAPYVDPGYQGEPPTNQNNTQDPNALAPLPSPVDPNAWQGSMSTNPELPTQEGLASRQQARNLQTPYLRAAGLSDPVGISSATPLTNLGPSQYWQPIDYTSQIQGLQARLAALGPVNGDPTQLAFDLQAAQNGYGGNGPGRPGWVNPDPIRAAQIQQQLSNMTAAADLMNQIANLRANQPQLSGASQPAYTNNGQSPVTPTISSKQNPTSASLGVFLDALNSQSGTKRARDPMAVAA